MVAFVAPSTMSIGIAVGIMFVLFVVFAFTQMNPFLLLGALLVFVVMAMKGFLRFHATRRLAVGTWRATVRLVTKRRMTKRSLRNLGITAGVILLIVGFNALGVRGPGKARGISMPTEAFSLDFSFSSDGDALASVISYLLILIPLGLVWWRFSNGLHRGQVWFIVYFVCLAVFVLAPAGFAIAMATIAPDSSTEAGAKENAKFAAVILPIALALMATSFCAAAMLTHLAPAPVQRPARLYSEAA